MIPILLALAISQQVTLTYPIPQLDNCRDAKECYFYCEIPQNKATCQQFSRSRNLTKILGVSTLDYHATASKYGITYPIRELSNCQDHHSCKSFCNLPQNYSSCTLFAKKYHIYGFTP